MKGIRDETQPHCRIFTIPPSHFYLHEKNAPKITFITFSQSIYRIYNPDTFTVKWACAGD